MPKVYGFHEGDRSEFLAEFVLSTIGLPVQVPRTADYFLTDFLVHLVSHDDKTLKLLGLSINVQVKSNEEDIEVKGDEQRSLFYRSLTPFFLLVVDKNGSAIKVYTTAHRLRAAYTPREEDVILRFGGDPKPPPKDGVMMLGPPIYERPIALLDDPDVETKRNARSEFLAVIVSWAQLDVTSAAMRFIRHPMLPEPTYETNKPIDTDKFNWGIVIDEQTFPQALSFLGITLLSFDHYLDMAQGFKLAEDQQGCPASLRAQLDAVREKLKPWL